MSAEEQDAAATRRGKQKAAMAGVTGSHKQKRDTVDAMSDDELARAASATASRIGAMPIKCKGKYSAFNKFFDVDNNKENHDGARPLLAALNKPGKCSFPGAKKVYAHVTSLGLTPSNMMPKQFTEFYVAFCKQFPNFTTDMC
jgi:hypothetical protein